MCKHYNISDIGWNLESIVEKIYYVTFGFRVRVNYSWSWSLNLIYEWPVYHIMLFQLKFLKRAPTGYCRYCFPYKVKLPLSAEIGPNNPFPVNLFSSRKRTAMYLIFYCSYCLEAENKGYSVFCFKKKSSQNKYKTISTFFFTNRPFCVQ